MLPGVMESLLQVERRWDGGDDDGDGDRALGWIGFDNGGGCEFRGVLLSVCLRWHGGLHNLYSV